MFSLQLYRDLPSDFVTLLSERVTCLQQAFRQCAREGSSVTVGEKMELERKHTVGLSLSLTSVTNREKHPQFLSLSIFSRHVLDPYTPVRSRNLGLFENQTIFHVHWMACSASQYCRNAQKAKDGEGILVVLVYPPLHPKQQLGTPLCIVEGYNKLSTECRGMYSFRWSEMDIQQSKVWT